MFNQLYYTKDLQRIRQMRIPIYHYYDCELIRFMLSIHNIYDPNVNARISIFESPKRLTDFFVHLLKWINLELNKLNETNIYDEFVFSELRDEKLNNIIRSIGADIVELLSIINLLPNNYNYIYRITDGNNNFIQTTNNNLN